MPVARRVLAPCPTLTQRIERRSRKGDPNQPENGPFLQGKEHRNRGPVPLLSTHLPHHCTSALYSDECEGSIWVSKL
jgi:hypothetical protein